MTGTGTEAIDFDSAPVLLHVGLHKCASTWLQDNMFGDPEIGFAAPWGRMAGIAVTEFVTIDPLAFDAGTARDRLRAAAGPVAEGLMPVVSHEALSSRPHHGRYYAPYVAERLRATFGNARLLLIFREQKALIRSLYGEYLRNGGRVTLREFIGTGTEPPGFTGLCELSFFEFDRLVAMYRAVFGAERVLALPLEMLSRAPEDFVARICAFAGRNVKPLPTERKVNTAWGPVTYDILRHSNAVVRGDALKPRTGRVFRLRRKALNGIDRVIPSGLQARTGDRQKAMIAARVGDRYRDSNARLAELLALDLKAWGYDCP